MKKAAPKDAAWLLRETGSFARWLLVLARRVLGIAPFAGAVAVVMIVVANVALIFAFFLPLKVILLAGSDGVPWYVRALFGEAQRDQLIVSLSVAAVAFYLVYLGGEWLAGRCIERGSGRLLAESRKIAIFENQEELARGFFRRLCNAIASVFFALAAAGAGLALNGMLFGTLLGIIVVFYALSLAAGSTESGRDRLRDNLNGFLGLASGIGFLLFFGVMLGQFLTGVLTNLIVAIVSLIMGRQILQRCGIAVREAVALTRNREKIDALFFHDLQFHGASPQRHAGFWELLEPGRRETLLTQVLSEVNGEPVRVDSAEWRDLGLSNVAGLLVTCQVGGTSRPATYLVKLFGPGRRSFAQHEATLLSESFASRLPAPTLVGAVPGERLHCLVYDDPGAWSAGIESITELKKALIQRCWTVDPGREIAGQFSRTKPLVFDRVGADSVDRLRLAANSDEETRWIQDFEHRLPEIITRLESLPLSIYNPDLSAEHVISSKPGSPIMLSWSRWSVEPVGAGWPIQPSHLEELPRRLATAAEERPALSEVAPESAMLAALLFGFERQHRQQRYRAAIALLPRIESVLSEGDKRSPERRVESV